MPAEIVTVGFCAQYGATFEVPGSKGANYLVRFGADGQLDCTCPAFAFSGDRATCKHASAVWAHGCLWNPQWHDAGPNDLGTQGIRIIEGAGRVTPGSSCPGCGGGTIAVRIAV